MPLGARELRFWERKEGVRKDFRRCLPGRKGGRRLRSGHESTCTKRGDRKLAGAIRPRRWIVTCRVIYGTVCSLLSSIHHLIESSNIRQGLSGIIFALSLAQRLPCLAKVKANEWRNEIFPQVHLSSPHTAPPHIPPVARYLV